MEISCDTCAARDDGVCHDCVVTFLLDREAGDALVVDLAEAKALRALSAAGLVPEMRHRERA